MESCKIGPNWYARCLCFPTCQPRRTHLPRHSYRNQGAKRCSLRCPKGSEVSPRRTRDHSYSCERLRCCGGFVGMKRISDAIGPGLLISGILLVAAGLVFWLAVHDELMGQSLFCVGLGLIPLSLLEMLLNWDVKR